MGATESPRFEEPGAKVERCEMVRGKVPDTVGVALRGGQHLDVDAAHDVFDHRTVAIHVGGLQVGLER
jgi:hypothetical protein